MPLTCVVEIKKVHGVVECSGVDEVLVYAQQGDELFEKAERFGFGGKLWGVYTIDEIACIPPLNGRGIRRASLLGGKY